MWNIFICTTYIKQTFSGLFLSRTKIRTNQDISRQLMSDITYFRDINNIFNIPQIFGPKVRKWKRCSVDWVGVAHILWWWHTTSTATRRQVQICRSVVPTSDGMVVPAGDISAQCNVLLCAEMMTADILNTIYTLFTLYNVFYILLIKPSDGRIFQHLCYDLSFD